MSKPVTSAAHPAGAATAEGAGPVPRADLPASVPASNEPRSQRDWVIDILRVASMLVVVLMHWTLMRVTLVDGKIQMQISLHGPVALAATWALQVMPLFFIAGGFANTVTYDKALREGGGYGTFVGLRARRLLTPLMPLLVLMLLLLVGLNAAGLGAMAWILADQAANVLWFLSVYLGCVALTPLLVTLHDRAGAWAPLLLLGTVATGVDVLTNSATISPGWRLVNIYAVWGFCHQLGVVYARRTLHRLSPLVLLGIVLAAASACWGLVQLGPYAPNNLGLADRPTQNLIPPNAVIGLIGIAQLPLVVLLGRWLAGWAPTGRVKNWVQRLNALLMVIFLWHLPASFVAIGLGLLAPDTLLPTDEGTWWALRPLWWIAQLAILAGLVALAMRWELYCHQFAARTATIPVLLGAVLGVWGVYLVWIHGMGYLHRDLLRIEWWAITGQLMVLAAIALTTTVRRARGGTAHAPRTTAR